MLDDEQLWSLHLVSLVLCTEKFLLLVGWPKDLVRFLANFLRYFIKTHGIKSMHDVWWGRFQVRIWLNAVHTCKLFVSTIRFNVPLNTESVAAALQSFSFCKVLCCCFAGELLFWHHCSWKMATWNKLENYIMGCELHTLFTLLCEILQFLILQT